MNIKTIVKVMNFHALLRVDRASREAEQYAMLGRDIVRIMDLIQNNRNLILDRRTLSAPSNAPRLRIFIGSDLGFCGAVNASVNAMLDAENGTNTVIIVGRKIHAPANAALCLSREEFEPRYGEIEAIIANGIHRHQFSGVDICYDDYIDISHIEPICKTVFPIELERDKYETYTDDFSIEGGDANTIMEELMITYISYEVKIAAINSFASENVIRQATTNESLKKIDELETEELWHRRKLLTQAAARKSIDSYIKTKWSGSRRDS